MCATVSGVSVQIATLQPSRAAAYAASHPACPAPITITSKVSATVVAILYHRGHGGRTEGRTNFFLFQKVLGTSALPLCPSVVKRTSRNHLPIQKREKM